MYALILTYTQPLGKVEAVVAEHRAFLDKYYQSGDLICSGPQNPRTGGFILARFKDRTALEEMIANDPFTVAGVADYKVIEFEPVKFAAEFERFL